MTWGAEGTVEVEPEATSTPAGASFGNLTGPLDPGAAVRFEARSAAYVLLAGVTYLHLDAERDVELSGVTTRGELNTVQWTVEAGAGYRLSGKVEALATARYCRVGIGSPFGSVATQDGDDSWVDGFLGLRVIGTKGRRFVTAVRGEVGAGGSEFAFFGSAELAYRLSGRTTLRAEYRILSSDRDSWDVVQNGLGLAVGLGL